MIKALNLLLTFVVTIIVSSCGDKAITSPKLVMADSAYMKGNYQLGDALLESVQKQHELQDDKDINYYHLLTLEQAYVYGDLSTSHFSLADSLYRYYKGEQSQEALSKSLLFLGNIYYRNGDYPTAIDYYLKAKDVAKKCRNLKLLCLISRNQGDLYFDQRILEECIPYYREYYQLAVKNQDTLRMAYGARCMDLVHTIDNNVDSMVYYCQLAIELGKNIQTKNDIVPLALYDLCDIYIQTEQYDKALDIMPRDELNDANWAYWHYGQHHLDSAVYYFKKTLGRYKWQGETEVLRILAELERERGNLAASLDYYERLAEAEDSLKVQQRAEETMRIKAQYNYSSIQQQRDELEHRNREMNRLVWLLFAIMVAVMAIATAMWWVYKRRKDRALAQQQLLEQEKETLKRQSQQQLEENEHRLAELEQALATARQQNDRQATERLAMDTRVLESQNQNIEAIQQRRQRLLQELHATDYYQRLKSPDPQTEKKLSTEEWEDLATRLDDIYNGFTTRLLSLARLSETELRICRLVKIGVPPAEIADIIFKSKSAVTHARRRMYMKLTKTNGTADDCDALLQEL